jgi:hypothetical protein
MAMATSTIPTKSTREAVRGTQLSLNENLRVWRISCQIGGPGRPWIRAMTFRWIPSRRSPKTVAAIS